jgi:hypothetical protein
MQFLDPSSFSCRAIFVGRTYILIKFPGKKKYMLIKFTVTFSEIGGFTKDHRAPARRLDVHHPMPLTSKGLN